MDVSRAGWCCRASLILLLLPAAGAVDGQQFRMESTVELYGDSRPVAENLTLCDRDCIYDFSYTPGDQRALQEIVIYERGRKSFILLDVPRKLRLKIEQFQLVQMLEQMRLQGASDSSLRWLVQPRLEEQVDLDNAKVVLQGEGIRYSAQCERISDPALLGSLYEFMDQFTMLSASDPRRLPPFARMQFNQTLRKYGLMPVSIELLVEGRGLAGRDLHAISRHTVLGRLSQTDLERIEQARRYWVNFRESTLEEYRELEQTADAGTSDDRRPRFWKR